MAPCFHLQNIKFRFSSNQQLEIDRLKARFEADPFAPPSVKECQDAVGDDVYRGLLDIGDLTEVAQDVVFRTIDYQRMQSEIRSIIDQNGSITVAQARDHFNTSRKFILALLNIWTRSVSPSDLAMCANCGVEDHVT